LLQFLNFGVLFALEGGELSFLLAAGFVLFGAQLAQRIGADSLSRVFAGALAVTGMVMLHSSFGWP